MIGALLNDRYLLESELGQGGMGVVYRSRDTLLERDVAVKLVLAGSLGTEGHARLLREAQAAASLNHPNIVAVYDVGKAELDGPEGGSSYIVMELVAGRSLRLYRPESLDEIIDICAQVCTALEQAHDHPAYYDWGQARHRSKALPLIHPIYLFIALNDWT